MKTILHTVDIDVPPAKVFEALSTERGLSGWWTPKVKLDLRIGGTIAFTFGKTFNPEMLITSLEKPNLVGWKCIAGHGPWLENTFRFEIEPRGSGCVLFFQQEYSQELSNEEYGRYNFNWGYYLESLRLLVVTGTGKPYMASTVADKKTVVERFVDEYKNRHNPNIVDDLVSEDCKVHIPLPGLPQGREGMRINGELMCGAFPDVHVEREFFVVDGNIIVERANAVATHKGELLGTPPTGKKVTWSELHAYRVEGSKITEVWSEADFMGVMLQIGAVKFPAA
ncbi:ester cyclase [bacterium]|nr:ester cyclase [bacterium]MCI0605057.1 ester cyclase [bacterium]